MIFNAGGPRVVVATTVSTAPAAGAAAAPAGTAAGRFAPDYARKRFQKHNVYYVLSAAARHDRTRRSEVRRVPNRPTSADKVDQSSLY